MIYCNLKESTPVSATYYYGDTVSNLSGEFAVTRSLRLEVIKQPEKCGELTYWLGQLLYKHRNDFANGKFREKIAYEC